MRTLMWFRSDLRVEDNTALHRACLDEDDGVVGVYAISPGQWREHDKGGNQIDFILRNLRELKDRLGTLNIPLRIVRTKKWDTVPDHLLRLARSAGCGALYFNQEHEVNERERDERVRDAFDDAGLAVRSFVDQTILEPDRFRTGSGDFYSVYTPFKRKWLDHFKEAGMELRPTPAKRTEIDVEPDDIPDAVPGFDPGVDPGLWPAGEAYAKRRLASFINDHVGEYAKERDNPAVDGTSRLSPYLALGVISARQCMAAAMEANGGEAELDGDGAPSWMNEVVWREFYKHVLVGFPRVSKRRPFQTKTEKLDWNDDDGAFEMWCAGRTGFPIVDAGMRQLAETGWMHNRLRMIVAMFLTKDLFIDWRRGEEWFARHLVDHDLASNNGGWQWSASTGTDAQPYFRVFNPYSQSRKCDPEGVFIKRHVPELGPIPAGALHDGEKLARAIEEHAVDYPAPMVDRSKTKDRVVKTFKAL